MSGKTVAVGSGVGVGGILGIVILLHQFGVPPFGVKDGAARAPVPAPAEGEAEPKPPRTSERVGRLEERVGALERAVEKSADRLGALATEQSGLKEKVGGVKDQVDRLNADQGHRFETMLDRLNDMREDARAERRRGR